MRKIFSTMMLVAAAAMASVSCQKDYDDVSVSPKEVILNFSSEKPSFNEPTKTEWTGTTIQWSKGDAIRMAYTVNGVWQNASGDATDEKKAKFYQSKGIDTAGPTANFAVSTYFTGTTVGEYQFYGVYPASVSETDFNYAPSATITIPVEQTPVSNSFDPAADFMIGIASETYQALPQSTVSMVWTRMVAHAELVFKTLNGLADGEKVRTVTLKANTDADMVGVHYVDITTNAITLPKSNTASNQLVINGDKLSFDADGNLTVWVCFLPCTWTTLAVEIETDAAVYTRDITISGEGRTFLRNAHNVLPINMSRAVRVQKDVVGRALPFEETFDVLQKGDHNGTGSSSLSTELSNFDIPSGAALYEANGAIRLAKGDVEGSLTTIPLDLSSAFYVKVKAKGWDSDEVRLTVKAGLQSQDIDLITYNPGDFVEYVVNFDAIDNSESVVFSTASGVRVFIDEIEIGNGSATAAPMIVSQASAKVPANGGAGEIAYTVYNAVDGVNLIASSNQTWLTIGSTTGGKVAFMVEANDATGERSAVVTLTYGAVTETITVTQDKKAEENEDEIIEFYESFDQNDGKGGNDGSWSGSLGTSTAVSTDKEGWTFDNQYKANKCVRFGNSTTKKGYAETPALGMSGDLTLTFKAGAWKSDSKTLTLSVSGGGTLGTGEVTLTNESFTQYKVQISGAAASTKIKFSGNARFFLDEVKVVKNN